jgi:hypothetical protein
MQPAVGIFLSQNEAERAVAQLRATGIPDDRISLLTPATSPPTLDATPTMESEQPGMGTALGAVTGGAAGLSAGALGAAVASALIPGIGPIIAVGFAATVLAGLVGAAGGGALGNALEDALTTGLPRDELFVYEDALRKGRTVVLALAEDDAQAQAIRGVWAQAGAESIDAAREQWWVGLRDAEEAVYQAPAGLFAQVEQRYRNGFEAALALPVRGKSYAEAADYLRVHYPTLYLEEPFRQGYERGQAYYQALLVQQGTERTSAEG